MLKFFYQFETLGLNIKLLLFFLLSKSQTCVEEQNLLQYVHIR